MGDVFEHSGQRSRSEISDVLTALARQIDNGALEFQAEGQTQVIDLPGQLALEFEVEDDETAMSLEIELEWPMPANGPEAMDRLEAVDPFEFRAPDGDVDAAVGVEGAPNARFEIFQDRAEEWRWRLIHRNGNVIATSGEGYTRKHNARKGLRSVIHNVPTASIVDTSGE